MTIRFNSLPGWNGSALPVRGLCMQPFIYGVVLAANYLPSMIAFAELAFFDMVRKRSLPEWTDR